MERLVCSNPYVLREQFVAADGFGEQLKARGWTLAECRPTYSDPQVIR